MSIPTTKPIALITGANRGIGFTLAQSLARDHSFHVLLGARSTESGASAAAKLQAEGLSVEPLTLDLSDDSSIAAAAKTVQEKYGRLDVLVNNAAVLLDPKTDIPKRELYASTFDTNVAGTAAVTEAFIPLLSKSSVPRVVFLSSRIGAVSDRLDKNSIYDQVDSIIYRSSKAAVNMLAAHYARAFAEKGWKVNVVCPGWVKTDMNEGRGAITTEEAMPNLVRVCTLGADGETGTFTDVNGGIDW